MRDFALWWELLQFLALYQDLGFQLAFIAGVDVEASEHLSDH
jgi:hypothetical protein